MTNDNLILLGENNNVYNCDVYVVIEIEKNKKPTVIGLYNNLSEAKKKIKNNNYSIQGPINIGCKTETIPMINKSGIITDFQKTISSIYTN